MATSISAFSSDKGAVVGTAHPLMGEKVYDLKYGKVYFFERYDGTYTLARMVRWERPHWLASTAECKIVVQRPRTREEFERGVKATDESLQCRLPAWNKAFEYLGKQPTN